VGVVEAVAVAAAPRVAVVVRGREAEEVRGLKRGKRRWVCFVSSGENKSD
jgi:hypothetical protein